MAALERSDVQDYLKENYDQQEVHSVCFEKNEFLDYLPRNPNCGGKYHPVPVMVSGAQGTATVYATAAANADNAPGTEQFQVDYGEYFSIVNLSGGLVRGGRKDRHAFIDTVTQKTDEILKTTGQDLDIQACGNGGAPLGQVSSVNTTTNIITLVDRRTAINFWKGQKLVASAGDGSSGSHTLLDSGAAVLVTHVNHNAGTVTYSGTDISGLTTNSYLFREGCFAGAVSQTKIMKGIAAWNPYTAPGSSDSFMTVNRYNQALLYGYSSSGQTDVERGNIVERLEIGATEMYSTFGASPETVWVHPRQFRKAAITLQQKGYRRLDVSSSVGYVGYSGFEMTTDWGKCMLRSDRQFNENYARFTNRDHIELISTGEMVSPPDEDGLTVRKIDGSAAWRWEWWSYGNIAVNKPSEFGVILLPSV